MTIRVETDVLARLLAGLQVPCSLNALGAAREPYIELTSNLELIGWMNTEEIKTAIENTKERRNEKASNT